MLVSAHGLMLWYYYVKNLPYETFPSLYSIVHSCQHLQIKLFLLKNCQFYKKLNRNILKIND